MTSELQETSNVSVQMESDGEETEKEALAIKRLEGEEEYLDYVEYFECQKAKLGETVTFKVIIIAKPSCYVYWRFNDQIIKEDDDNFVTSSKGNHYKLTIKKMSTETVGNIEVVAGNPVGVASMQAKLELENDGEIESSGNVV